MASVVLRSVGAAAGNAVLPGIGGAFLGTVGNSFGGIIDGQLGLGTQITGPRLENLSVQDSRYGAGIPIIYGHARVAGNVIWASDLIQTQHNNSFSGGKGGISGSSASTTTYTYSVHCAVGIVAGPIGSINTIWADSNVIYQDGVWASGLIDGATIYTGTATQNPDSFMQSLLGSGNVPAYRGLAYIVLENLQLASFGNRLPNLTFEIIPPTTSSDPSWLGETDANLDQRPQTTENGGMMPIIMDGSSTEVRSVIIGGYQNPGSSCVFSVVGFDVSDVAPAEISRVQSGTFLAASPSDSSWAMSPDGRYVAMYLQSGSTPNHNIVIYDSETQQFGSVYSVNLPASASTKQIGWIDAQHFLIDDSNGSGHRGLHAFARAGLNVIDLGFTDVWAPDRRPIICRFITRNSRPLPVVYSLISGTAAFPRRLQSMRGLWPGRIIVW